MDFNFGYYFWNFSDFSTGYNPLGESIEVKYNPIAVLMVLVAIVVKFASCAIDCTNIAAPHLNFLLHRAGGGSHGCGDAIKM